MRSVNGLNTEDADNDSIPPNTDNDSISSNIVTSTPKPVRVLRSHSTATNSEQKIQMLKLARENQPQRNLSTSIDKTTAHPRPSCSQASYKKRRLTDTDNGNNVSGADDRDEQAAVNVDGCKAAWKSLRNSVRYQIKARQKTKSGSEAQMEHADTNPELYNEQAVDWEFADCMSFMTPSTSAKSRRTTTTDSDLPRAMELTDSSADVCTSNYSYMTHRRQKDLLVGSATSLTESINELVNLRKNATETQAPRVIKHFTMLSNLDRMLQKLPDENVEELGFLFTKLTFEEIQKHKKNT